MPSEFADAVKTAPAKLKTQNNDGKTNWNTITFHIARLPPLLCPPLHLSKSESRTPLTPRLSTAFHKHFRKSKPTAPPELILGHLPYRLATKQTKKDAKKAGLIVYPVFQPTHILNGNFPSRNLPTDHKFHKNTVRRKRPKHTLWKKNLQKKMAVRLPWGSRTAKKNQNRKNKSGNTG